MSRVFRHLALFIAYGALCVVLALAVVYALHLRSLPDLKPWHGAHLDSEFSVADVGRVRTLADYRALEDRLFAELRDEVSSLVPSEDGYEIRRFAAGSRADPVRLPVNWNRTFELDARSPRGGVLLLHGMSDSPYSLRALGERLNGLGYRVVGLRLPGHGTAPSGLLRVRWEDMAAAVRLAARDLASHLDAGEPLYIFGYSAGAALAVEYALARVQDESLPPVRRLVLLSPAIGVSPVAGLAVWQARLSVMLNAPKVAWVDIGPEYDPYKYVSFAVNAGEQVHRLTQTITRRLDTLNQSGPVAGLPPILAFQSVADATVSAPAVVDRLFRRLAPDGHELVLFDINREAEAAELFAPQTLAVKTLLLEGPALPFGITVLANAGAHSLALTAFHRDAGSRTVTAEPSGLSWPTGVFSMSHVALPFAPDDPVYGATPPTIQTLLYLGRPELRGERDLLAIPAADLIRLRHNPFFGYMQARIEAFIDAGNPSVHAEHE